MLTALEVRSVRRLGQTHQSTVLDKTSNWIGAGGFLGYLTVTIAVGLGGSNLAGLVGVIGIPFGMIVGIIGAAVWKRNHRS